MTHTPNETALKHLSTAKPTQWPRGFFTKTSKEKGKAFPKSEKNIFFVKKPQYQGPLVSCNNTSQATQVADGRPFKT
ncbi:hypothetical protein HMPREF1640_00285 [Prevotella sp. S7-1-8]|nr:hypothetical protein HMPREF1640_00285 [Prevotella sp. S7-1-8]